MRATSDAPRSNRLRTLALVAVGLVVFLFLSASGLARMYTDWLWFDQLDHDAVYRRILFTRASLAIGFTLVFFALLWTNLWLADRFAPRWRGAAQDDELLERYNQFVAPHSTAIRLAVSVVFALIAGLNTSTQWRSWLLFANRVDFGWEDPLHEVDAGFYVFQLPFLSFGVDWLFAALVFVVLLTAIAHYLNGGIRAGSTNGRVTSAVKLHLSVLLGLLALVRAAGYFLDRYELVTSTRGAFDGAFATDVDVQLPALNLLVLISLFGAALFLVNAWRRGWVLPVVAVSLWAFSHIVVGSVFPALYQRLRVEPEQSTREAAYISDNIEATRYGMGLNTVDTRAFAYEDTLTPEELAANEDIAENIRILDPELAVEAYTRTQGERDFYRFSDDLDVDRYTVDGQLQQVVLSARGLDYSAIGGSWENRHVAFTHGYGVALSAASSVDRAGLPQFAISGLGDDLEIADGFERVLEQPRLYFSEGFDGYAIVGASRDEIDYTTSDNQSVSYRYTGEGGVPMGSLLRRAAFALRFQRIDPLISQFVTDDSEVLYIRDVRERAKAIAPFLDFDSDPYPVIAEGRIQWVIDAYTTTSRFPYAQRANTESVPPASDLGGSFNYARNSVKAVVDAYDGDVSFYVVDEQDPIIASYRSAFPGLFKPAAEAPAELAANFRYPEDLFRVQTNMYSRYFVDDPVAFYQGNITWDVAQDPGSGTAGGGSTQINTDDGLTIRRADRIDPQYVVTRLPGEDGLEFVLLRPFALQSRTDQRPELTAFMVGRSDAGVSGQLVVYSLPAGRVSAPSRVDADIRRNSEIAPRISLLNQQGSTVNFGDMVLVPIGDTLVYVRPFYVKAEGDTAIPELQSVIAVNGDRVAIADSLEQALQEVTQPEAEEAPPPTGEGEPPAGEEAGGTEGEPPVDLEGLSVSELLVNAQDWLTEADGAEADGETAGAAELRARALAAIDRINELLGVGGESLPAPGTTTPEPASA